MSTCLRTENGMDYFLFRCGCGAEGELGIEHADRAPFPCPECGLASYVRYDNLGTPALMSGEGTATQESPDATVAAAVPAIGILDVGVEQQMRSDACWIVEAVRAGCGMHPDGIVTLCERHIVVLLDRVRSLERERQVLQEVLVGIAERVAQQSDLLSRAAEAKSASRL